MLLKCSNSKCGETVICIANGRPTWTGDWIDDELVEPTNDYVTIFSPLFFYPHLKIFKIPDETPDSIREPIFASFQIFFCNPRSSLGNLRIALEEVLNFLGVKNYMVKTQPPCTESAGVG